MLIIGITGTIGAGKGTVADYLVKRYDCRHYSARAFLNEGLAERGWAIKRENMLVLANQYRADYGADYIIRSLFERAAQDSEPAVLESVRSAGEVNFIQDRGGRILAVDAQPELRYQRIRLRNGADTDQVSLEQFLAAEKAETSSSDPAAANLLTCIKLADATVDNSGDLSHLYTQVDNLWQSWQPSLAPLAESATLNLV